MGGYTPRFVSVATGEGISELEADLARRREADGGESDGESHGVSDRTRVTVLAGPSGVGKSSLINRLRAGSALAGGARRGGRAGRDGRRFRFGFRRGVGRGGFADRVRETTEVDDERGKWRRREERVRHGRGHQRRWRGRARRREPAHGRRQELQSVKAVSTSWKRTAHHQALAASAQIRGLLADTPGFGYPSLEGVTVDELISGSLFPEIALARRLEGRCKFADCTHRDEPGCAVDAAMPWEEFRHDARQDVFDEVEAAEKATKAAGYKRETRVRYKDGSVTKKHSTKKNSERDELNDEEARGGTRLPLAGEAAARSDAATRSARCVNRRMEPKLETKSARRQSRRCSTWRPRRWRRSETETLSRRRKRRRRFVIRTVSFFFSLFCLSVRRSHESPSGDIRQNPSRPPGCRFLFSRCRWTSVSGPWKRPARVDRGRRRVPRRRDGGR